MRKGLYLHIPFCKSKCVYCDFTSFAGCEGKMAAYIEKMCAEIRALGEQKPLSTLYIGGGTPTLLPADLMARLLDAVFTCLPFASGAECSCECNPGTVTPGYLSMLRARGINRLSFGVQSFDDRLLRLLSRIHTAREAEEAVAFAREAGFDNINLDIMLGLPGQTEEDVLKTLEKALRLQPAHLSCYGLIVEEGTPLDKRVRTGEWTLPDEETERAEYELCRRVLFENGYEQYEISNFARPGYACRHNIDCWERAEYIGIGCAACGFENGIRYRYTPVLEQWLSNDPARVEKTPVTPADAIFESVMLGLRMTRGVPEASFQRMHGKTLDEAFGDKLAKPMREGLLIRKNGCLRLTEKGMDLQNRVLVDLMD